jgi:transketolase
VLSKGNAAPALYAVLSAAHHRVDNLTAILDRNSLQVSGPMEASMRLEPLAAKWKAFDWEVLQVDGHGIAGILEALGLAGRTRDKPFVVLDADLSSSTRTSRFATRFSERYFEMGIAEQNLYGVAAGLAACGKIPFASTFAVFATERALNQIRQSIAYPNLNVKIVSSHSGFTASGDGGSRQTLLDVGLTRCLPNMNWVEKRPLAPVATTIVFSPLGSTMVKAVPLEAVSSLSTLVVSTPLSAKPESRISPK